MTASPPTTRSTVAALLVVGRALGRSAAYQRDGAFYFDLGDGWALRLSPDSAGRFRLAACYGATEVDTMWSLTEDWHRLADLVQSLRSQIAALAA
jgi:hypothetical protein